MKEINAIFTIFVLFLSTAHAGAQENFNAIRESQKNQIWRDLKPWSFYELTDNAFIPLKKDFDTYEAIDKSDQKKAKDRLAALSNIVNTCKSLLKKYPDDSALALIRQTAAGKAIYILKILKIPKTSLNLLLHMDNNHQLGRSYTGRYQYEIKNHLAPTPNLNIEKAFEDWRNASQRAYDDWLQHKTKEIDFPNMWFWLESQNQDLYFQDAPEQSKAQKLKERIVLFDEEGKAYHQTLGNRELKGISFSQFTKGAYKKSKSSAALFYPITTDEAFNYIITTDGELFIYPRTLQHSFIAMGRIVICAGELAFKNQKIYTINTNSGHYQPSPFHLKKALKKMVYYYKNPSILTGIMNFSWQNFDQQKSVMKQEEIPDDINVSTTMHLVSREEIIKLKPYFSPHEVETLQLTSDHYQQVPLKNIWSDEVLQNDQQIKAVFTDVKFSIGRLPVIFPAEVRQSVEEPERSILDSFKLSDVNFVGEKYLKVERMLENILYKKTFGLGYNSRAIKEFKDNIKLEVDGHSYSLPGLHTIEDKLGLVLQCPPLVSEMKYYLSPPLIGAIKKAAEKKERSIKLPSPPLVVTKKLVGSTVFDILSKLDNDDQQKASALLAAAILRRKDVCIRLFQLWGRLPALREMAITGIQKFYLDEHVLDILQSALSSHPPE